MSGNAKHKGPMSMAIVLFGAITLAAIGCFAYVPAAFDVSISVGVRVSDYEYLDDYGEWIYVPPHGRVWHPHVVVSWQPFFHGHWIWSNHGWAWVSYEPYGWLVYHYGYWDWRPRIGWIWIPGTRWSPARVQWVLYGDYYAWAPMPPPRVYWPNPWDPWDFNVWVVVGGSHFTDENVGRHHIERPVYRNIHTRNVVRSAPSVRSIETATKRTVPLVRIEREQRDIRPEAVRRPPRPGQPVSTKYRSMVLPESERNRVKEHAPAVEREVLKPRGEPAKKTTAPEKKRETKKKQSERQDKSREKTSDKKVRRR